MAIVAGVNIPDNKRVEIALTSIYGIGPKQAKDVIGEVGILNNPRVKDLSESELNSIRNIIDKDRIIENEDGDIELGLTLDSDDQEKMLLSEVDDTETSP